MTAEQRQITTPGASIDTLVETPPGPIHGLALIAHPHPLHGGTRDNKVAHTLARAALGCGLVAVRPNFRGVGASSGAYDHGVGEAEDLLAIARILGTELAAEWGPLPWTLMGFSFGCYVQHRVSRDLAAERLIMVGPAVSMYAFGPPDLPTVIFHGDQDELIPVSAVQAYAQSHDIPLEVIPGASHFFHGKLVDLRQRVEALCQPHL